MIISFCEYDLLMKLMILDEYGIILFLNVSKMGMIIMFTAARVRLSFWACQCARAFAVQE